MLLEPLECEKHESSRKEIFIQVADSQELLKFNPHGMLIWSIRGNSRK